MHVYIGTYTGENHGDGIYLCDFDPESGTLIQRDATTGVVNPSFLAIDPSGRFVLSANETEPGEVAAFERDLETGNLTELNREESQGSGPCYISTDVPGRYAFVANYGDGALAVLPLGEDGHLQPASDIVRAEGAGHDPARQEGPHGHMIAASPDGRWVLATDLGLDTTTVYDFDTAAGTLTLSQSPNAVGRAEPGAGPRHFAFSPDGATVYTINELSNTITAWDFADGGLTERQTIGTLPDGYSGESFTAQIVASADGRHVYGSNRGHDSIAIFAVGDDGTLTASGHQSSGGVSPRNFVLDPTGAWLLVANQQSDNIVVYRRNPEDGSLIPFGEPVSVPSPVCILFANT
ncbi:MAG TPA: lactonase family protein [Thermomicrobiales bacterium]|nr:lactonase family protein [Thermomicrobiales bacterium]